jgi:hypothetical protein
MMIDSLPILETRIASTAGSLNSSQAPSVGVVRRVSGEERNLTFNALLNSLLACAVPLIIRRAIDIRSARYSSTVGLTLCISLSG